MSKKIEPRRTMIDFVENPTDKERINCVAFGLATQGSALEVNMEKSIKLIERMIADGKDPAIEMLELEALAAIHAKLRKSVKKLI